jgi:phage-related holin
MQALQSFLIKLWAGIMIFMAPVQASVITVFALVLVDLVFGLMAAAKKGEKIESRKLAHTPVKLLVYFGTIVVVYAADTHIGLGVPATKIVTGIIGATEILSLLEKAETLTGAPVFAKLREMLKPTKDAGAVSLPEQPPKDPE